MKALVWNGINELGVEQVPDPQILNSGDAIVKVKLSSVCGSDLHLLGGYIPAMRAGDVLGHEFMGTVAEVGPGVTKHQVGDRVVVVSFTSCGQCWYCKQGLWSLCDNGNPNPGITEALWGQAIGGCYGYSHALGGWAGSHARYIRVPYADQGAFAIPDGVGSTRIGSTSKAPRIRRRGALVKQRPASARAFTASAPNLTQAASAASGARPAFASTSLVISSNRVVST